MRETAEQWSLRTWKDRHDKGYFPKSTQHRNWKIYDEVPEWLSSRVTSKHRVLEIGCGYGQWMIPLARICGPKLIVGVDIHREPIDRGIQEVAKRKLFNLVFYLSDGLKLMSLLDESFHVVYSISVFQHLPRSIVEGYLKETDRVLSSGGIALHHFRNADNVGPYPPLAQDITAYHTGDFSCGWTAAQIVEAGEKVGWECEIIDLGLHLVLLGKKK